MTHIRIVIDNEVLFDDNLKAWQASPPDQFRDMIKPDAKPEPWMKAIMIVMTDAAMTGDSVSIEATTGMDRPGVWNWWSMEVTRI